MKKLIDVICRGCQTIHEDKWVRDGILPNCHLCGGETERIHVKPPSVIGDDIPGGYWAKNGICNPDGTPKRYDTKSSMRDAATALGYVNCVEHVVDPEGGTDKNPHTQKFVAAPLEDEEARVRAWWEHERLLAEGKV